MGGLTAGLGLRGGSLLAPPIFSAGQSNMADNFGGHHLGNQNIVGDQV